jgi:phosphotriesterase-related protein
MVTEQARVDRDVTMASARATTGSAPGLPYQLRVPRPRIAAVLGEEAVDAIVVRNPARAFAVSRP